MHPFAFRSFLFITAAVLLAMGGCASTTSGPSAPAYRTVTVDPRRDTDQARTLNEKGMDFLAQGHLDLAIDTLTRALEADVEFGPAHNNLGLVYFRQKDWYKAAWEFQYAINLLPRFAEPHNNLGLVLEGSGQLDQAIEHYRQSVALGADIQYRANLARCLVRRDGRTEEVRKLLAQLVDQDPRPPWRDWARRELAATGDHHPAAIVHP